MFLRVVGRWYRQQAKALGYTDGRCGSVTFVQRFGSSLNVNPHVHVLMLDGVYADGEEGPRFVAAPPLTDDDVQQIVQMSAHRIIRLCTKRGLLDDSQIDPLSDEEPVLAANSSLRTWFHRHRGACRPETATSAPGSGHRGTHGPAVRCLTRFLSARGDPDRCRKPSGSRTVVPLCRPAGPGSGTVTHH